MEICRSVLHNTIVHSESTCPWCKQLFDDQIKFDKMRDELEETKDELFDLSVKIKNLEIK